MCFHLNVIDGNCLREDVFKIKPEDNMAVSSDKIHENEENDFSHIFKEKVIEKYISLINLVIASCSDAIVKWVLPKYIIFSIFPASWHHHAKLGRFVVIYNHENGHFNCGYCSHKVVCKHKALTASKVSVFEVFLVRIQSECGKIRTRKTLNTDLFHAVFISVLFEKE